MKTVKKSDFILGKFFVFCLLFFLSLSYLYPLFFMFINSIKTQTDYMVNPFSVPLQNGQYNNYVVIFTNFNLARYMGNTLLVTVGQILGTLPFAVCAGYAFAKLRFIGRNLLYIGIMVVMFIPFQVIMIPLYVFYSKIGLMNSFFGLILWGIASGLPGTILLLTAGFRGIPNEILDSGKIDGCGYFRILWNLIVPMGIPAIAINVIMGFIGGWNGLLPPMLLIKSLRKQLIIPALSMLVQQHSFNIPFQMTGLLVATLPAIIIYLILQKQIIMGVSVGALK
jgi:ABC-type glycerol-3-phosphate transport system permease component